MDGIELHCCIMIRSQSSEYSVIDFKTMMNQLGQNHRKYTLTLGDTQKTGDCQDSSSSNSFNILGLFTDQFLVILRLSQYFQGLLVLNSSANRISLSIFWQKGIQKHAEITK